MSAQDLPNQSATGLSLSTLCHRLCSERLQINCENNILRSLNSKIDSQSNELSKLVWICRHEQELLHQLIVNSGKLVSPDNCCQLDSKLNSSVFVEAHRVLNQYAGELVQVYKLLAMAPRAVAIFLNSAERFNAPFYSIDELCSSIFNLLYGSCFFPEDEKGVLELLGYLITVQLVQSADPRKFLRKGNSAFSRMYKMFSETLSTTKIFLTAALHEPIIFLLSQDELFLDIDPSKSTIRFPTSERRRRFGADETAPSYKERVIQHRKTIVDKLVIIAKNFVNSILSAMASFPPSITWLVGQMHTALIEKKLISKEEAALICTDLIFTYFICSAMVNPEPLGIISDTPISNIARFNLMQIGQILQTLAFLPYEQRVPAYYGDILSRLDRNSMKTVMDTILQSQSASIETIFPVQVPDYKAKEVCRRRAFVGTMRETNILQAYLKSAAIEDINDAALRKNLKILLKKLPDEFEQQSQPSLAAEKQRNVTAPALTQTPSLRLKNFADRVQNVASRSHQRLMQTSSVSNLRNFQQRNLIPNSSSSNLLGNNGTGLPATSEENLNGMGKSPENSGEMSSENQVVLVFAIPDSNEPIGLGSEEDVLESLRRIESKRRKFANGQKKKKTRFLTATESIVSDRTTTDVVSDEEEEEGEEEEMMDEQGAGGSSVSSSNENAEEEEETEDISTFPDNISDVVPISANVSGRGSPSLSGGRLSGRETPFSGNAPDQGNDAVTTIPAIATQPVEPRRTLPTIPVTVRKQNSEGLEEKFGKFGLPPQDPSRNRDETVSLVSDSWSTDVVASDNEGLMDLRNLDPSLGQQQQNQLPQPLVVPPIAPPAQQQQPAQWQMVLPSSRQVPTCSTSNSNTAASRPPTLCPTQIGVVVSGGSNSSQQSQQSQENGSGGGGGANSAAANLVQIVSTTQATSNSAAEMATEAEEERPYYDSANLTRCRAFLDAKRKLRLVLSFASNNNLPAASSRSSTAAATSSSTIPENENDAGMRNGGEDKSNNGNGTEEDTSCDQGAAADSNFASSNAFALQQLLNLLLAESINNRDRRRSAQIREVQRTLSAFDGKGVNAILRAMKREYRKRQTYVQYLQQSRLILLQLDDCLDRMDKRIRRDKELTAECLIEMLVRLTLQKKDQFLRRFVQDFQQLGVQDEKIELVDSHLRHLCELLVLEPMWRSATLENLEYARKCLERALMAHIYVFALFPNGEADYYRDEVLSKSIHQLSAVITVDNPELAIPKSLHAECPWPSAQAELTIINAYKSPRDKMACIFRCCETIENLIILSSNRTTASADDILPILVFVILKANPPALLSNLQFIEGFYASRMHGNEAYWWTQFSSAVEFLKTLLNKLCT